MSTRKLCFYISSVLVAFISISQGYAQPHAHGDRPHTHGLPTQGIAHRHNNGAIGQNIQAREQISEITRNNASTTLTIVSHEHGGKEHKHPLPPQGIKHRHGSGANGQASKNQSAVIWIPPKISSYGIGCRKTTISKYVYKILRSSGIPSQESQLDLVRKKNIRATLKRCSRISIPLLTKEIVKQGSENKFSIPASFELGRIGTEALRPLEKLINHPDVNVRKNALLASMIIGKETRPISGSIRRAFSSKDRSVKFRAAVTLLAINPGFSKQIYPLLLSKVEPDKIDILAAINYLGFVDKREPRLYQVLLKYIQHEDEELRISALHLIQKLNINIDSIMSRLIRAHIWENVILREGAERAMETIGDKAIPFLKVSLNNENRLIRKRATYILGRFTQKNIQKSRVNRLLNKVARQASSDSEMKRISLYYLRLQRGKQLKFKNDKIDKMQSRRDKSCRPSADGYPTSYDIYTNTCVPLKTGHSKMSSYDFSKLICEYFGGCQE